MDKDIESRFVKTFLQKRVQERIIWELASKEKRRTAIFRFCHTTDDIVKPQCVLNKSNQLTQDKIQEAIRELTVLTACYVISSDVEMDGKQTRIENAVSCCIGLGMPSIIIIGEQLSIIETEQGSGASIKYILRTH